MHQLQIHTEGKECKKHPKQLWTQQDCAVAEEVSWALPASAVLDWTLQLPKATETGNKKELIIRAPCIFCNANSN